MSTCPTGFRPYPPSNNCYFLTERAWPPIVYNKAATSLAECIALCASHHGAPACLTSADEIKSAGLAAAEAPSIRTFSTINPGAVWIGNYRSTSGESICLDGTTTLPWPVAARPSRMDDITDCALLHEGKIVPKLCNHRSFESWACICEAGATVTSSVHHFLSDWDTADQRRRVQQFLSFFVIALFLALLPPLLGCLRRKGHGSTVSSDADATTIQKAQEQAAILRSRIVRALGYSGWFFLLLFVIPSINVVFASDIAPGSVATVIGPWCVYWMGMAPSILMIVLTVQPTDAVGVRRACRFFFGFSCFMFTASSFVAVRNLFLSDDMALNVVNFLVWCPKTDFFSIPYLAPTLQLKFCCKQDLPPRTALRRMWLALRFVFFGFGIWMVSIPAIFAGMVGGFRFDGLLYVNEFFRMLTGVSFMCCGLAVSPSNRGRLLLWIADLAGGRAASKQQEAATIAALVGKGDASKLLTEASTNFRALPVEQLHLADLLTNVTTPDSGTSDEAALSPLNERTVHLDLGACEAFFSHSW